MPLDIRVLITFFKGGRYRDFKGVQQGSRVGGGIILFLDWGNSYKGISNL